MMIIFEQPKWAPLQEAARSWTNELRVVDLEELLGVLQDLVAGPVLVVLPNPRELLAIGLSVATSRDTALEQWKQSVTDLLAVYRRNRRNILLIEPAALVDPEPIAQAILTDRFALSPETMGKVTFDPATSLVELVFAGALIDSDEMAGRLANDMAASMLLSARATASAHDILDCFEEFTAIWSRLAAVQTEFALASSKIAGSVKTATEIERERMLLKAQFDDLRNRHVQLEQHKKQEIRDLSTVLADRHVAWAMSQALERRLVTESSRHALREAVLGAQSLADARRLHETEVACQALIERLAVMEGRLRDAENQAAEQQADSEQLRAELARVYASRSWKVTGPLRATSHRLARGDVEDR